MQGRVINFNMAAIPGVFANLRTRTLTEEDVMSTVRAAARQSFSVSDVDASTSNESRLSSFWESSDHDTTSLSGYSPQSDSELLFDWNMKTDQELNPVRREEMN